METLVDPPPPWDSPTWIGLTDSTMVARRHKPYMGLGVHFGSAYVGPAVSAGLIHQPYPQLLSNRCQ